MINKDKPVGQRIGHGRVFGSPYTYGPNFPRAPESATTFQKIAFAGWDTKDGRPHGRSGDKLARKAMKNSLGVATLR